MADVMVMPPPTTGPGDNSTTLTDTQRYLMAALIDPEQLESHQTVDQCGTPPSNIHSLVGRHHPEMLPRPAALGGVALGGVGGASMAMPRSEVPPVLAHPPAIHDPFAPPPPSYVPSLTGPSAVAPLPPKPYEGSGHGGMASPSGGSHTEGLSPSQPPPPPPPSLPREPPCDSSPPRSVLSEGGYSAVEPAAAAGGLAAISAGAPALNPYQGDGLYGRSAHYGNTFGGGGGGVAQQQPVQPSMFATSLQEALYPGAAQQPKANAWAIQPAAQAPAPKPKKKKKKKKTPEEKARLKELNEKRIRTALLMNLDDLRESLPVDQRAKLPDFNETSDPVDIELCLKRHARTQKQRTTIEFMHSCVRGIVVLVALTNLATRGRMGVSKYGEMVEARLQNGSWNPLLVKIYKRYFRHAAPSPLLVVGASLLGLLFYDIMNTKSGGRLETGIEGAKSAAKFLGVGGEEATKKPEGGGVMDAIGGVVSAGKNFLTNKSGLGSPASSSEVQPVEALPTPDPATAGTRSGLRPPPE